MTSAVLLVAANGQTLIHKDIPKDIQKHIQNGGNKLSGSMWDPLTALLQGWLFTENFAVTVGNADGRLFEYTAGSMTLHTHVETASTSKWPLAMTMAGLVNDGTIHSLDDPVHKYLDWWTNDKADNRSYVTLSHLLSFTSGFGDGAPGANGVKHGPRSSVYSGSVDRGSCLGANNYTVLECAKWLYNNSKTYGRPGTVYSYNSIHLQLAGGLAEAVTGMSIQQVLAKYLWKPYGMVETTCLGTDGSGVNPELAVCLNTTGSDYEMFLKGQLAMSVNSPEIIKASETDHTPFLTGYSLYGHYGYGHFLECFDSATGFTPECEAANTHIDPGAFGYYPLLDRKNGFYLNVVAYEVGQFYPRSGIPEYLGLAVKPLVDAIMRGENITTTAPHHGTEFLALAMVDVNYCIGCYAKPLTCA